MSKKIIAVTFTTPFHPVHIQYYRYDMEGLDDRAVEELTDKVLADIFNRFETLVIRERLGYF